MPRFVEVLLRFFSHWATVAIGIAFLMLLVYIYNKPRVEARPQPLQTLSTPGIAPSQDAGILGGIARQQQTVDALTHELTQLRQKIERLEQSPKRPSTDPKVTAKLQQELRHLQAQIAARNAQTQAPTPPAPTPPAVTLRVIRATPRAAPAKPSTRTSAPPRLQVAATAQNVPDDGGDVAPYLPPQSVATGRVKDGYTGLASLETFPVTLDITSAFSAPNGHSVPLTGCRLGARATPEELTARGRLNLTKITCVSDTGFTIEQPIEGYVTAYDNINGQIAQVFTHERDAIAAFGKGAVPVALVSLFKETRNVVDTTSFTGVVTQTGNAVAQETAGRIADIYLDKAEKLLSPIIWVGPDTPVYIYITKGARLKGLRTSAYDTEPLERRMLR